MSFLDSYDHRTATHCGAGALRNVADFYGWGYDEPACFGLGAGLVFDLVDHPDEEWPLVRTSAAWLVEAFFENLKVPHFVGEGDDWDDAWDDVAATLDGDDPVVLFLDADELAYVEDGDRHPFPHAVVAVGYDDEDVQLSDATEAGLHATPRETLREAWNVDGVASHEHRYLTVTRGRRQVEDDTAAARAIDQTVDYFGTALDAPRTTGAPGDEGISAMERFATDLATWGDLDDPKTALRTTVRSLGWHGEGAAHRGLYADALAELAPRAGLGGGWSDQFADVAAEWRSVVESLESIDVGGDETEPALDAAGEATLEEVDSVIVDVARREEEFFERLDREI